jgi:hypothetical protein
VFEVAAFERYLGIDYSGAQTPTASLKGLRVYLAAGETPPGELKFEKAGTVPIEYKVGAIAAGAPNEKHGH